MDFEQQSRDRSASLDLLLRFQRLLISKLYPGESICQMAEVPSKLPSMLMSCKCQAFPDLPVLPVVHVQMRVSRTVEIHFFLMNPSVLDSSVFLISLS